MGSMSTAPGLSQIVMGVSQAPAVSSTSLLGASGSATIEGTNISGKITLVVAGIGVGAGKVMTMTYADMPAYKNGSAITFTAGNANFATINGQLYAVSSKTGVDLYVTALAISAGTYVGYYQIIGY